MPESMYEGLQREGGYFYCPNGHTRGWGKGTLAKKLEAKEAELERAKTQKDFWEAEAERERKRTSAAKGQATKLRKRAEAGACPICNRTFVQLSRHMGTKHPDYASNHEHT